MNVHRDVAAPAGAGSSELPSHPAVLRLLADGVPGEREIAAFLAASFPLVEPGAATFAWRGTADEVELVPFSTAGMSRAPFRQLPGTDLWLLRLPVADVGRFEYKLAVRRDGGEEWIVDPLNPNRAEDPFGQNSVCRTWGYARPAWSEPQGAPSGRVESFELASAAFDATRVERVYLPAGYDPRGSYPLLIVHDGVDYLDFADLAVSLDNLIAAGDIPPLVTALTQTGDRPGEYAGDRRHARYLACELLPELEARYGLSPRPAERVLLGASLGAVASLTAAFRYPGRFGGLVLKSGSFVFDERKLAHRPHAVFFRIARLVRAFRRAPPLPPTRAFVSTGELEGLASENMTLASFLRERGVDVLFKSAWDGHHWHNWRDQLRDGLRWVLRRESTEQG